MWTASVLLASPVVYSVVMAQAPADLSLNPVVCLANTVGDWEDTRFAITTFGEDDSGELYLADRAGSILRFESPSTCQPSDFFTDGFESGNTSAWNRTSL